MAIQREYLSPNEIAEYLGVSPFTIRRYIKLGELRAVSLLGGFRVHRSDLQAFLKAHEVNPAEEALEPEDLALEGAGNGHVVPSPSPSARAMGELQPSLNRGVPAMAATPAPNDAPPVKRKRGRPRKHPLPM